MTPASPTRTRARGDVGAAGASLATDAANAAPTSGTAPTRAGARGTGAGARGRRGSRLPWLVAIGVYTVLVGAVVGWPTPVDAGARAPLSELFAVLYGAGVPGWFDYAVLEKTANAVMFVPFGLLITGMAPHRWWTGIVVPGALSAAAELAQHVLLPERVATWTDVAANTAGAAIGVAVALAVMARGRPARRASRHRR